jgi:orotate phosphoribosyltransferase
MGSKLVTTSTAVHSALPVASDEVLRRDDPRWARLHQIIDERSLGIGDYILSSGKHSKYHFELRKTTMFGEGMRLIAQIVLEYMKREGLRCVGGKVQGAVPIAAAVCLQGELESYPVQAFFVRAEEKKHGRGELVDGYVSDKDDILLVDDVATSGGSILDAIKGLQKAYPGTTPRHALVIVDRQQGAEAALAAKGIQLVSLFARQDFTRIPPEDGN